MSSKRTAGNAGFDGKTPDAGMSKASTFISSNELNTGVLTKEDLMLQDTTFFTNEQHDQRIQQNLEMFWRSQAVEMETLNLPNEQAFKNYNDLPLARIKRIMKSDEDVRMISAEAPVLFAKASELFILELTIRAWGVAQKAKRQILLKEDLEKAIETTDIFDFLVGLT